MNAKPTDIDLIYGLEPVLEPGEEAGSDALETMADIACPYCAEQISVHLDLSAGMQTYIEDCQVCCQPISITITLTDDGRLHDVTAQRGDQ
jgi:hypothetical protein